ncbi:hypothetical protein EDB81DRAFT_670086 [Dactylonectria macrodidyma]|uniref:Protein kinase domain-containing protein n=1 Tax=Dactylonectria macrodidyma TaxID=307937 RepID=A0A9P9IA94_9HYPO|nr:hypothetical protein EDB81DRAFT_670086 [Dactylonectria macrodidyma]
MALRRKSPFYIEVKPPLTHRALPAYLNRRPEADYYPLGSIDTAWIGQRRNWRLRQLATVQQLKRKVVSELNCLAQIAHENIAQPIALYSEKDELYIVYEYMDLDLFDLLPLSETEISSITSAFQYLKQNSISFYIDSILLNSNGVVKISGNVLVELTIMS